jgi:hypothetical protein
MALEGMARQTEKLKRLDLIRGKFRFENRGLAGPEHGRNLLGALPSTPRSAFTCDEARRGGPANTYLFKRACSARLSPPPASERQDSGRNGLSCPACLLLG